MTDDQTKAGRKTAKAVVSNPAGTPLPNGTKIESVSFGGSDASKIPKSVKNWEFFEGSIVAVFIRSGSENRFLGSAAMIAPGLAVTATHIFADDLESIRNGTGAPYCTGIGSEISMMWAVCELNYTTDSDIAFLSIKLLSSPPEGWTIKTFALTTRTPVIGEHVSVLGFRLGKRLLNNSRCAAFSGHLYASTGTVAAVHHHIRDRVMMPFPVIEIACGTLGGMSGGALIDIDGFLLGVNCGSFETEDQEGPASASWIIGAITRRIKIPWPTGLYPSNVRLLEIDPAILCIEGREHVRLESEHDYSLLEWSK